jgi:hypothetical protein
MANRRAAPKKAAKTRKLKVVSDHSKSTSFLKRQTCRILGNRRALQCPNAVCFRGFDQSLQESTPNSATTCGSRNVDSNFSNARVARPFRDRTQSGPSKHPLIPRNQP